MKKVGLIVLMVVLLLVTTQLSAVGVENNPINALELTAQGGTMETKMIVKEEVAMINSETAPLVGYSIQDVMYYTYMIILLTTVFAIAYTYYKYDFGRKKEGDGKYCRYT